MCDPCRAVTTSLGCRLGTIEEDELGKLRTLVKRLKIEVAEDRDPRVLMKAFIESSGVDIQKSKGALVAEGGRGLKPAAAFDIREAPHTPSYESRVIEN